MDNTNIILQNILQKCQDMFSTSMRADRLQVSLSFARHTAYIYNKK